jgi:archaellin
MAENQIAAELEAGRESVWKNKPPPVSVQAGNTSIDLNSGTITLSNGTRLNIKTGLPAGDIMTLGDGSQIDLSTGQKVIKTV